MMNQTISNELSHLATNDFSYLPTRFKQNSIKNIFLDNYSYLLDLHLSGKLSDDTLFTVQKMLLCSSPYLGYSLYQCSDCGNQFALYNSCKSRFCNKCGIKYARQRASHVSSICLDVTHRHIVFTIPSQLRSLFLHHKQLLHLLFIASLNTLNSLVNRSFLSKLRRNAKKQNKVFSSSSPYLFPNMSSLNRPAAISSLHTFGRDLKFSPHIHMLVAETYYHPKKDKLVPLHYFDYQFLRKTWQYQLLHLLKPHLSKSFIQFLYTNCSNGFYVYAQDNNASSSDHDLDFTTLSTSSSNVQKCMQYMLRYTGRPAMAESRISHYDSTNQTVEWFYSPHEEDTTTKVVVDSSIAFIRKLLLHLPLKHFKMTRYYGLYANACSDLLDHAHSLLGRTIHKFNKELRLAYRQKLNDSLHYRNLLICSFGVDPLQCSCGKMMDYIGSYCDRTKNGEKVISDEEYRRQSINEMRKMPLSRRHTFLGTRGVAFQGSRS